jgi:gamma-glutamylcyclotransferase (GGCT)/AIG2-like uncharacterized protein YtfP
MSILSSAHGLGHLVEALTHFNSARDGIEQGRPKTEIAQLMFHCLNKIQTGWMIDQPNRDDKGEVATFTEMILEGISGNSRNDFLLTLEVKSLVDLEPQIMNHETLRRGHYRPDVDIPMTLLNDAMEKHRKLVASFRQLGTDSSDELARRVLKRLSDLLYVVRSNIAHGEKTPYGPDRRKVARDETVCAIVIPVQLLIVEMLLDCPRRRLIVYGTLAPGEANDELLAASDGEWHQCCIRGSITTSNGLRRLHWNPANDEITVKLFASKELPSHWQHLDSFEGTGYKRRLIPARIDSRIQAANVYLAR